MHFREQYSILAPALRNLLGLYQVPQRSQVLPFGLGPDGVGTRAVTLRKDACYIGFVLSA